MVRTLRLLLVLGLAFAAIPTVAAPAVASASPARTPSCVSDQLQVLGSQWLGALGNGAVVFDIANTGAKCGLEGYPSVVFLDAKGRSIDDRDTHDSSSMQFAEPKKSMVTLAAGGVATFGVSFSDNPVNNDTCPKVASAVVQLRSGVGRFWGELSMQLAPCGNYLSVTPIEKGAWPRPNG
jgi:hypothetical protein